MNRDLNPVFAKARGALETLLDARGFSIYGESHYPGAFGSADVEYQGQDLRLQLVWDGKDRWLWVRVVVKNGSRQPRTEDWKDVGTVLGQPATSLGMLAPGPLADRRIDELVSHTTAFLDRGAAV